MGTPAKIQLPWYPISPGNYSYECMKKAKSRIASFARKYLPKDINIHSQLTRDVYQLKNAGKLSSQSIRGIFKAILKAIR